MVVVIFFFFFPSSFLFSLSDVKFFLLLLFFRFSSSSFPFFFFFSHQDETQRKLNVLLGEELEIRRRVAHIDWSENCLARFRTELGPPDFIHAWRNHRKVRKSLYRYRDVGVSVLDRVYADIRVAGNVQIVTERGPTDVVTSTTNGNDDGRDILGGGGTSMMNEFRQEVFKTSSPTKGESPNKSSTYYDDVPAGTNSLASSIRTDIQLGRGKQAPNVYASSPTVASLGLPSSTLRPLNNQVRLNDPASSSSRGVSSTEGMQSEWSQYMRQDWGLPKPPVPRVAGAGSSSPSGGGGGGGSLLGDAGGSTSGASSFGAVDAFVSDRIGGTNPTSPSAGDFKDSRDDQSSNNNNNNNNTSDQSSPPPPSSFSSTSSTVPPPSSGFPGMIVPPPPTQKREEDKEEDEQERTKPDGALGAYWERNSMTSHKRRYEKHANSDQILPELDSRIITSRADRALVFSNLPNPGKCTCDNLNLDGELRRLDEIQDSIIHAVNGEDGGLLFIFQSGNYVFGSYSAEPLKFHPPEDEESPLEMMTTHCGTKSNYLFSLTHDLKVRCCWLLLLVVVVVVVVVASLPPRKRREKKIKQDVATCSLEIFPFFQPFFFSLSLHSDSLQWTQERKETKRRNDYAMGYRE